MNTLISVCSILLVSAQTSTAASNFHNANTQPEFTNHIINKRSPEVVSAKKGCIDGCLSAEHQKTKISEIEPDAKNSRDEADQDGSVTQTTSLELLLEDDLETVVEHGNGKRLKIKNKHAPCVAAAAFIESLLNSQESTESKESILEELYEYYDQLNNSSKNSDEEHEVVLDTTGRSKNISKPHHPLPKKVDSKHPEKFLYYTVYNESVSGPEESLVFYTESDSDESSPSSSSSSPSLVSTSLDYIESTSDDSSDDSSGDSSDESSDEILEEHIHTTKSTLITGYQKLSPKKVSATTESPTVYEEQTVDKSDSSPLTTESLTYTSDTASTETTSVTESPANVKLTVKEKDEPSTKHNITHVIKRKKPIKYYRVSTEDLKPLNVTEFTSSTDTEVTTQEPHDVTDTDFTVDDINVASSEKDILTSVTTKPYTTEEQLQTETDAPNVTKRPKSKTIKHKVKDLKDLACINRLSKKYSVLKVLFQPNDTDVSQSPPTVLIPVPLDYIQQVTYHLRSSDGKEKSCKRLRILIAKILEALSKLDVPVENLIKATKSKHSKRGARDIGQILSQISGLSDEHAEVKKN